MYFVLYIFVFFYLPLLPHFMHQHKVCVYLYMILSLLSFVFTLCPQVFTPVGGGASRLRGGNLSGGGHHSHGDA